MQNISNEEMTFALANLEVLFSLRMFEGYHMDYEILIIGDVQLMDIP